MQVGRAHRSGVHIGRVCTHAHAAHACSQADMCTRALQTLSGTLELLKDLISWQEQQFQASDFPVFIVSVCDTAPGTYGCACFQSGSFLLEQSCVHSDPQGLTRTDQTCARWAVSRGSELVSGLWLVPKCPQQEESWQEPKFTQRPNVHSLSSRPAAWTEADMGPLPPLRPSTQRTCWGCQLLMVGPADKVNSAGTARSAHQGRRALS